MRAWKRMRASTPLPRPHGACSPDRPRLLHRHDPTHTVSTPEHAAASHAAASHWKARNRKKKRTRMMVRGTGGWHQVSTPPGRRPPPYPHPRLHSHPGLGLRPCPCPCQRARPCRHPGHATGCGHAPAWVRKQTHGHAWTLTRTWTRGMRLPASAHGLHASARP